MPNRNIYIKILPIIFISILISNIGLITLADPPGAPPYGSYRGTLASADKEIFAGDPITIEISVSAKIKNVPSPSIKVKVQKSDKAYAYAIAVLAYERSYETGEILDIGTNYIYKSKSDYGVLCDHIVSTNYKDVMLNIEEYPTYTLVKYKFIAKGKYERKGPLCSDTSQNFVLSPTVTYYSKKSN